jgi:hypothetical protein
MAEKKTEAAVTRHSQNVLLILQFTPTEQQTMCLVGSYSFLIILGISGRFGVK